LPAIENTNAMCNSAATCSSAQRIQVCSAFGRRDGLHGGPCDEVVDAWVHLATRVVDTRECLAQPEPQLLQGHRCGQATLK